MFKWVALISALLACSVARGPGMPMPPRPPTPSSTEDAARAASELDANADLPVHLFGGDIVLTPEQQTTMEATSNPSNPFSPQNAVITNDQLLWSGGLVYYTFDGSLSEDARTAIDQAMETYSSQTCISFQERQNEEDYLRFFAGNGCFSYIGRTTGQQDISIGRGCEYPGIVMHEIFHALGRWHEQSRPDRDLYIQINDANIVEGVESNFEKVSSSFATTQGVPYDYGSIMHYDAYAFSRNTLPTIQPLSSNIPLSALGQRNGFSASDIEHVNALYCEDNGGSASWGEWGAWSACTLTCNGGSRTRTRTCSIGFSCAGSNIDIDQCNTQQCRRVTPTWSSWGSWSGCSASCGTGRRSMRRVCVNGNTCVGSMAKYEDCNTDSCPEEASWGGWGSWSGCSETCQGGTRFRRRNCRNGNICEGANNEVEFCNSEISCADITPPTAEWSVWSECTESCGGGTRFRTRQCGEASANCVVDSEDCNTQDCDPEPQIRGVGHAGCFYVPVFSDALRFLEGTTPDLLDHPFDREEPLRKCGAAALDFGYQLFAVSVGYCISGSSDIRDYNALQSAQCIGGIGGYYAGWYLMDVYQITSAQSFADSVEAIVNASRPTQASTTTPQPSPTPSASNPSYTTISPTQTFPSTAAPVDTFPTASPTPQSDSGVVKISVDAAALVGAGIAALVLALLI